MQAAYEQQVETWAEQMIEAETGEPSGRAALAGQRLRPKRAAGFTPWWKAVSMLSL